MKLQRSLALLAATVVLAIPSARAAVALTVSPSVISNDYRGVITLNLTGLAAGQAVRIEKFADYNLNGVLDTNSPIGESLIQSFPLTDGVRPPTFGGVANFNVPGDGDGTANGVIAAQLQYAAGSEANRSAGRFVYRVVNPGNSAVLAAATLQVNQAAQAQRITGTVSASGGGVLSNAFVLLLSPGQGGFLAGVLSDTGGNYSFPVPVGSYSVNAIKSGFVTLFNQSANVTVGAAQVVTTNIVLTAATRTVSGRVTDESAAGVGGLQMNIGGDNSAAFGIGFTDANGNYSVAVPPGPSRAEAAGANVALRGYVGLQRPKFDTTAANVTGVNLVLSNATALVYGRLTNNLGQGVGGVGIEIRDPNGSAFRADGTTTFADGSYVIAAPAGAVNLQIRSEDLAVLGLLPSPANPMSGNAPLNGALQVNLGVVPPAAHLRGHVFDQSNNPVAGANIYASPQGGGNSMNASSAADGSFDLGVLAGGFYVGVSTDTTSALGLVASQLQVTVVNGVDQNNLLLVVRPANRQITGRVTGSSVGLGNVNVYGSVTVGGVTYNANANTDGSGNYSLGVFDGVWSVGVDSQALTQQGFTPVNNQSVTVSGATVNGINFNASPPAAHFRGTVRDENSNGIGGVDVYASPQGGGGGANSRTDAGGNFDLGVSVGTFNVGVGSDLLALNLVAESSLTLTAVNGVDQNGLVLRVHSATRRITGTVTADGVAVAGVNVSGSGATGGRNYNATARTDGNGQFSLAVFDGSWQVDLSGSDLANQGLPGVNSRFASVVGGDVTVNFIIITNPSQPTLQVRPRVGGLFQVRILGQTGPHYILESSPSLSPTIQWSTVLDTNSPSASFDVTDPNSGAGNLRKFYRVRATP